MRKLTKISLVVVMAIFSFITVLTGLTVSNITKANAEIKAVISNFNFSVQPNVQIMVELTDNGYSNEAIGLRFIAKADKDGYETLKANNDVSVKFGLVLLTADVVGESVVNNDNLLFKADGVYFKPNYGEEKKVKAIENSNLTAYSQYGETKYYYMNLTVDNSMLTQKDDEFIVVPYVKATKNGVNVYDVKNTENVVYSPALAGQLYLEKETYPNDQVKKAIKEAYMKGVVDLVSVDYSISYDGHGQKVFDKSVLFSIGSNIDMDGLLKKLDSVGLFDYNFYEFVSGEIKVNGEVKDNFNVYPNGKTNADINISFNAIEADESTYEAIKGCFMADDSASLSFTPDKKLVANGFAFGSGVEECDYVLYADGTIKIVAGEDYVIFGSYDLENKTVSLEKDGSTINYYPEVYHIFAGAYTGAYSFDKVGVVTRYDLNTFKTDARALYTSDEPFTVKSGSTVTGENITSIHYTKSGYNPTETGSYTLDDGIITLTFANETIVGSYDNGEFIIDGESHKKVDIDTLYNDLVGSYYDANGYNGTALQFTKNESTWFGGFAGQGGAQNWSFDYKIIPITETFGKIQATMTDKNQSSDGLNFYDFGKSVAEIYYVYDIENSSFNLSVSSGVSTSRGLTPTYNHFTDYTTDKAVVNDKALFTSLAETYTDGTNTLILAGLDELAVYNKDGVATDTKFNGGKATFNGNDITYSLIKLNETSGKIFFDMTATPQYYTNREDKATFVLGDYVIAENGDITVSFTYNDVYYSLVYLAPVEVEQSVYDALAGAYTDTWTLGADKSISYWKLDEFLTDKKVYLDATTFYIYGGQRNVKVEGKYKIYEDGTLVAKMDDGSNIFGSFDEATGALNIENTEIKLVEMDALTNALANGTKTSGSVKYKVYGNENYAIHGRDLNQPFDAARGVRFLMNGTCEIRGSGWKFDYDIIPITENFGKINTFFNGTEHTEKQGAETKIHYYSGMMADIYYICENNEMILMVSTVPGGACTLINVPYNHFVDLTTSEKNGDNYTKSIFDILANKGIGNYTDGENTLALYNVGDLQLSIFDKNGNETANKFTGGKAKFNGKDVTYSVVAMSATEGMFLIDMSATPQTYANRTDKTTFVRGTYTIDGDDINIKFTYNGVDYSFDYVAPVEVEQSVYDTFAGNYTDTYIFNADKTVSRRDLGSYINVVWKHDGEAGSNKVQGSSYAYAGHHAYDVGSYKLFGNGVIEITFGNDIVVGTYENGKFTVNETTNTKINLGALYTAIKGEYYNSSYVSPAGANYKFGIKFGDYSADYGAYAGNFSAYYNWVMTYEIIPITENFGKVDATIRDKSQSSNNFASLFDYGHSLAEIYYYYDGTKMNLVMGNSVSASRDLIVTYGHFVDISKDGSEYSTATYEQLAKTYTDGTNSLVLNGLTDLKKDAVVGTAVTGGFKGGYGTLNGNTITYSIMKFDANSGKIFFDMSDKPTGLSATQDWKTNTSPTNNYVHGSYTETSVPANYVQGDYVIDGSNITITFTYAGTTYTVTYTA